MKNRKQTKETKKRVDVPPAVLIVLFLLALGLGIFFIAKDAHNVNSAYSMIKRLYTLMFN